MCLLLATPTSAQTVLTSISLSQYTCIPDEKKDSMLTLGCFKGQRSGKKRKILLFVSWAIKIQSFSSHYLIRQQFPMVFLLLLLYLGVVACISEEINLGPCKRKIF